MVIALVSAVLALNIFCCCFCVFCCFVKLKTTVNLISVFIADPLKLKSRHSVTEIDTTISISNHQTVLQRILGTFKGKIPFHRYYSYDCGESDH